MLFYCPECGVVYFGERRECVSFICQCGPRPLKELEVAKIGEQEETTSGLRTTMRYVVREKQ